MERAPPPPEPGQPSLSVDPDGRAHEDLYWVPGGVDPRISLANERTFLAWIRTALGFMAAGVAITEVLGVGRSGSLDLVGTCLILFGTVLAVLALRRYEHNERRFAEGLALDRSRMPGLLTALMVVVAAIAMAVTVLLGR